MNARGGRALRLMRALAVGVAGAAALLSAVATVEVGYKYALAVVAWLAVAAAALRL